MDKHSSAAESGAGASRLIRRLSPLAVWALSFGCSVGWGAFVMLLFTLLYLVGGTPFLRLLTSDAQVVATATGYLPWAVLIPVAGMAAFVWDGVFIGLTATRGMLVSCAIASAVFFAVFLLLSPAMGNHALWLALLVYLALRGVVQTIYYSVSYKQTEMCEKS